MHSALTSAPTIVEQVVARDAAERPPHLERRWPVVAPGRTAPVVAGVVGWIEPVGDRA